MLGDGREGGFIKLYRRLESWPLWQAMSALQRMVWIELLLLANWRDREGWYGARRYVIRRGQLAHSEEAIAERAKVGRQVVRDTFTRLLVEGAITRERALPGNQAPWLTTIINYERFQGGDDDENPRSNQHGTNLEPAENQPGTPREEGKKARRDLTPLPPSSESVLDPVVDELVRDLQDRLRPDLWKRWFAPLRWRLADEAVVVVAPDGFHRDFFRDNYLGFVGEELARLGKPLRVELAAEEAAA